jgi:hypothetical protein
MKKHAYTSGERLDGLQRFFLPGSNPVPLQFFLVKFRPLEEEAQGSSGEGSGQQSRVDLQEDLLILVPGVEVRRFMVPISRWWARAARCG